MIAGIFIVTGSISLIKKINNFKKNTLMNNKKYILISAILAVVIVLIFLSYSQSSKSSSTPKEGNAQITNQKELSNDQK